MFPTCEDLFYLLNLRKIVRELSDNILLLLDYGCKSIKNEGLDLMWPDLREVLDHYVSTLFSVQQNAFIKKINSPYGIMVLHETSHHIM